MDAIGTRTARRRLNPVLARTMIQDAAERLMRQEGYAALSSRRVAAEAGLKPPLIHYHYATVEHLLLAVYERSARTNAARLQVALGARRPLRALCEMQTDPDRAVLAAELIAMAYHRKPVDVMIAQTAARSRAMRAEAIGRIVSRAAPAAGVDAQVADMLLDAVAHLLVLEGRIGIDTGHAALRRFVEDMIARIEPND